MDFEWLVKVKDKDGKPVADAEVALVQKSALGAAEYPFEAAAATHAHDDKGLYKPTAAIAPAAGEWVLIVRREDNSPVVQPLAMKKSGEDFAVSSAGGTVATLAMASAVSGRGAVRARKTTLTATLFPSAEVVFLSGTDYLNGGVDFRLFADAHARALLREKKIDAGTRVTLFSCDERARFSLAFSAAAGGVLCAACQPRQRDRRPLSLAAWQALRALGESGEAWRREWGPAVRAELRQVLGQYVTYLLGRRPRLLPYLGS